MGHLSTHVLDTSRGLPAAGVLIEVRIIRDSESQRVAAAVTNAQGRTDAPLMTGEPLERGTYELTFHVGDYFRRAGVALSDPPFLDHVVIRVGVADAAAAYHVPLLISPYGYTTYRGS
jgi:5-hydroxyisourate hydrolase